MSQPNQNNTEQEPRGQEAQLSQEIPPMAPAPNFPAQPDGAQMNDGVAFAMQQNNLQYPQQMPQEMHAIQNPAQSQTMSASRPQEGHMDPGMPGIGHLAAEQNQQQQLMQQEIEQQLIRQDKEIDSDSTSNMNLDSGTLKKPGEGIGAKQNNPNTQIDYFQNFDYDKNQSKIKDDVEQYPEPPSFLLNNSNNAKSPDLITEKKEDDQYQIQDSQQQHDQQPMQPQIQDSEILEETEQKQGKRAQGLPQPYDSTVYYDFKDFPDLKWEPYKDEATCPPSSYFDARTVENNGEKMERLLKGGVNKPILFDLQNTWLKGEQYAHILQNQDRYCKVFGIQKYECKQHPESIYIDPQDGLLYFVEGATIGSDFGFPRLGIRKRFKWKKMNFTTDLPKRDPLVSYIVASAVKCEKFFPGSNDDGPVYRMHAVILKKRDKTLQLPSKGEAQGGPMANKNEAPNSQESAPDRANEQQPCSRSGRVLTKSTKLKASETSKTKGGSNQKAAHPAANEEEFDNKNYILCHVRRVMGKRDDEFDSEHHDAESPVKKESSLSPFDQHRQSSKIPNKGKSKLDQIPFNFSEAENQNSAQKDRKMPNLKMFHGMSLDQIKKMKVGPDGKPLSLYKIKKYILPYHQLMNESPQTRQEQDEGEQSGSERKDSGDDMKLQAQQSQNRNKKRRNAQPMDDLEEQVEELCKDGRYDRHQDKIQRNNGPKELQQSQPKKSVEMQDDNKLNKQETFNNSQKVGDGNDGVNQNLNQMMDQDQNGLNGNNQLNMGNQNYNQLEQALALQNLLGGTNSLGLNNLGLQNAFGGVNGLMFNQLGALQNLGAQGQSGLNSLLSNPNNLGLNTDLALQNQLLGLQGNLGLNNFGAGNYGLNNINNLLGVNQLQGVNLNLLGQNPLNNQLLQQSLLAGQNGPNNQLLSKLNDQLKMNLQEQLKLNNIGNLGNINNELFLMNQNQNAGNRLSGDMQNPSNQNDRKKRVDKQMRKHESMKMNELRKNSAISPNLISNPGKDPKDYGVSPQLKTVPGNNFLGLGNAFWGNNNNHKRKQTNEQPNPFMDELLTNDLLRHCEKEYSRRLSGQIKMNMDDNQKSGNGSPKSNNLSNLMKSPDIQPITQKLAEHLNSQLLQPNMLNKQRKTSMVSNFGRDRLNSKVSAFKKYDSRQSKDNKNDVTTSPLIAGKQGEPSFGVESIQESKSVTTLRPPKNSVEGQSMNKKNDSGKFGTGQQKKNGSGGNQMQQLQQLQQYQQLLNQFPGQNLDQLQMNLPNMQQNNQFNSGGQGNSSNQPGDFNNGQNFNNGQGQSMKNGSGYQQQNLFQNQQLPQLLQYHQQQYNMLMNQMVNHQFGGMGTNNFNPLNMNMLQQQQLFSNGAEKTDQKNMGGVANGKNGNDSQQINQQINIIQNSKIQPVLSGLIFNQLGAGQGGHDGNGTLASGQQQNRKDSFQKQKNASSHKRSPKLGVSNRSRNNSQNAQFLNNLKMALGPNPTPGTANQPQDQMMGGNNHHANSLIIPPPSKQNSHRNSNVSNTNMLQYIPRESNDMMYNKHKFSITGAVINSNPNMYNPRKANQNQPSQLSNNSNKGGTQSQPVSQDNRQGASPDRNMDRTQQSNMSGSLHPPANIELMKSPAMVGGGQKLQQLSSSRRQSNNIDGGALNNNMFAGTNKYGGGGPMPQNNQNNVFMPPISRQSSHAIGGIGSNSQPNSASALRRTSDEQQNKQNVASLHQQSESR